MSKCGLDFLLLAATCILMDAVAITHKKLLETAEGKEISEDLGSGPISALLLLAKAFNL